MTDDPFVTHRSLLFTVAYEMLGSAADAEDVVLVADGGGEVAAVRRPVVGSDRVATLLSRFRTIVPDAVVGTVWLNGAPGIRIDLAGELDTAVSLVVAEGRITRIYAIRNPHKLARLDEEATLSR